MPYLGVAPPLPRLVEAEDRGDGHCDGLAVKSRLWSGANMLISWRARHECCRELDMLAGSTFASTIKRELVKNSFWLDRQTDRQSITAARLAALQLATCNLDVRISAGITFLQRASHQLARLQWLEEAAKRLGAQAKEENSRGRVADILLAPISLSKLFSCSCFIHFIHVCSQRHR